MHVSSNITSWAMFTFCNSNFGKKMLYFKIFYIKIVTLIVIRFLNLFIRKNSSVAVSCHSEILLIEGKNSSEELFPLLKELFSRPHVYIQVAPSTYSLFLGSNHTSTIHIWNITLHSVYPKSLHRFFLMRRHNIPAAIDIL